MYLILALHLIINYEPFHRFIIIDRYEPPFQSGSVTCDNLDEFACADGRECILKGNEMLRKI